MAEQRERAKADARAKKGSHGDTAVYRGDLRRVRPHRVAGLRDARDRVAAARAAERRRRPYRALAEGEVGELVLDRTPFYAESGGQVADAGTIVFDGGRLEVLDVQRPIKGLVVHQVRVLEGELDPGREVHARVDPEWRTGARQAHSGTHVVHAALREVLGPTALQSGSYNRPGYLRLDFGWTQALSPEQVRDIELVSQQALRADLPVAWDYMTLEQAKEWGAIALFGETYDNTKVRVVEIGGPWSRELCGGTHVAHSSQIGTVVVTGETSVGSGNRRIEALTGVEGFGYLARERDVVAQLTGLLKTQPDDLVGRVQAPHRAPQDRREGAGEGAAGPAARRQRRPGGRRDAGRPGQGRRPPRRRRRRRRRTQPGDSTSAAGCRRASPVSWSSSASGQDGKVSVVAATNDEARARGLSRRRAGPHRRARCSAARAAARTTSPRAAAPTPRASTRRSRW